MPSEPEKYSIDEMMDRLKGGPEADPADGELVTRADGSQAIRVKKRKRRSTQPHKEEVKRTRRARIVQVSAALVLVFLAILAIGGAVIYANSRPFRDKLVRNVAAATGAGVELTQFRMNPRTANAGGLALQWPAGNALDELALRGLSGEIFPSSFLGKSMRGEEVIVGSANLKLRIPEAGAPLRATPAPATAGEAPVAFNRYRTPTFDLQLGETQPPALRLSHSEVSLSTTSLSGRPQMRLYQGILDVAGWPRLRLDRGLLEFRGGEVDVIALRVQDEKDDQGYMEFSGTVAPYQPDRVSVLEVKLESFPIGGIAGPEIARFFNGLIDSASGPVPNSLAFLPTASPETRMDVAFQASTSSIPDLNGLPFLHILAEITADEWFERPVFQNEATGIVHREGDAVALREIDFRTKGRMALKGDMAVAANRALTGSLEIGLTEATITTSGNLRLDSLFGPVENGYRWVTVKLSGGSNAPADDFKELFNSAKLKSEPAATEGGGLPTFEDLTRPR